MIRASTCIKTGRADKFRIYQDSGRINELQAGLMWVRCGSKVVDKGLQLTCKASHKRHMLTQVIRMGIKAVPAYRNVGRETCGQA